MEELKHTPKPWNAHQIKFSFGAQCFEVNSGEDERHVIAGVYEKADAHLIAAAPEMLEALEMIIKNKNFMHMLWSDKRTQIQKAIAKARGRHE